jgi:hypothetical protein
MRYSDFRRDPPRIVELDELDELDEQSLRLSRQAAAHQPSNNSCR